MRWWTTALLTCALALQASAASHAAPPPPDPKDVRVLALNMYHEAKGEGRQGMLAIGWVGMRGKRPGSVELAGLRWTGLNPIFAAHADPDEDPPCRPAAW